MKLEKFKKNEQVKKVLIGSIVGLVLLIGGVTLYKTFALYEEKKEYNVLKGRVPDFREYGAGDIILAATINGVVTDNIPTKNAGYSPKAITCTNNATGTWDLNSWNLTISNISKSGTVCNIDFVNNIKKVVVASSDLSGSNASLTITNFSNNTQTNSYNLSYKAGQYTDPYNIVTISYSVGSTSWTCTLRQDAYVNGTIQKAGYSTSWKFNASNSLTIQAAT